ncbi:MAG: hypothetical protein C1943_03870 [Halochromatium sp.]|nr:hypothetical protein [Halochromatium sp.]
MSPVDRSIERAAIAAELANLERGGDRKSDDFKGSFDPLKNQLSIEQGMQWAIGDWYNAIPWGDKEAACNKAGLNYNTAFNYGQVAKRFEFTLRKVNCTFSHHQRLAIDALTPEHATSSSTPT